MLRGLLLRREAWFGEDKAIAVTIGAIIHSVVFGIPRVCHEDSSARQERRNRNVKINTTTACVSVSVSVVIDVDINHLVMTDTSSTKSGIVPSLSSVVVVAVAVAVVIDVIYLFSRSKKLHDVTELPCIGNVIRTLGGTFSC